MAGELMKAIGVKAGEPITVVGYKVLEDAWLEVYLCFNLLMSPNPERQELLHQIKVKLAEAQELIAKLNPETEE